MSAKTKLQHSIKDILKKDNSGSYTTRYDRRGLLLGIAEDIVKLGYKITTAAGLKQKHILAAVECWKAKKLSNATIKNRMSALRHLGELIKKPGIIPSNNDLDIGKRKYVSTEQRALYQPDFSHVTNKYIQVSLELQRVFGLRREESLKIKPFLADKKTHLELHPSWCKGGRGRFVPIKTEEQKYWLEQAKLIVGAPGNSLITEGKNYIRQRHVYDKQVQHAGLKNLHGLRHAYAQTRYKE